MRAKVWARCWLPVALVLPACAERPSARAAASPVVPGLEQSGLAARTRGLVLLGELGCVACHANEKQGPATEAPRGPDLATLGNRVHADYVARFLADPLAVAPGTTMPDLLRDLSDREQLQAAEALSHYLRSFASPIAVAEALDPAAALRGRQLFHEIGCVACHAPRDAAGNEVATPGSVPLGRLAAKYALQGLRTFLLAPHTARPSARMPDFHLAPGEAHDLANYLLEAAHPNAVAAPFAATAVAAEQVAVGRALFAERGCEHCHALADPTRAPTAHPRGLRELDPAHGCLSGTVGPWPFYALTEDQRSDLATAMAAAAQPLDDEQRILARLASRNCTACHARGAFGGVASERNMFFGSSDPSLGQESRLPPTLTGVGSKLQHAWLVDAIAHGQSSRPYLRTRMPGFGAAFATEIADLLARTDKLPPIDIAPLPADDKQARAVTDLGRQLVGDQGMNCITCHTFAGERIGTMGAVDLVESTAQRLRPQWFAHFLRAPFRFNPGTLMPQFFPDGKTVRPELGGGDAGRQIEAIWHYLADGRNVDKPSGMRRPPMELVVGDEAVILRRSVQHTGKRGISVGYPRGVNLTFDAERLAMNQIWWGAFVDASSVWTGQGSGEARILGGERVALPNGPAFLQLSDADAPWPAASRRELGQRFLGYDLDAAQRPTFRYVSADVTIRDTPRELLTAGVPADGKPMLRRTLQFASEADKTLWFRVAHDARLDDLGDGKVQVGLSLQLRLPPSSSFRIRTVGETRELLVPIVIERGRAELVIDYAWQEAGK